MATMVARVAVVSSVTARKTAASAASPAVGLRSKSFGLGLSVSTKPGARRALA